MNVVKNIVSENKYSIKCPYLMNPNRIVVHNTANDASARNEISYMISNNNQTSFHYAVDDKEIVQGILENRNAWHASDGKNGKGNREGIAIEICYSKSGGDRFIQAEKNAVDLIADILKRYGWGIDKVTKHQDYTNKYCPHRTLDMGWQRFLNMIAEKLNAPYQNLSQSIILDIQKIYNATWGNILGKIAEDNSAGPDTRKHLKMALQYEMNKQYNTKLEIDGSFGPATKRAFLDLKQGVYGNITWLCQAMFYIKGYNPNGLDKNYGPDMANCVLQFQRNNNLKQDKILGMNTAYKLFN